MEIKWRDAYRTTTTEQAISNLNNETIYSILNNSKGKYVKADRQVISGNNPSVWQKQVENYINNQIRKGKDVNFIAQDGFNYRIAYFEDYNGDYYRITMSVGKNKNINTIYNIGKMQNMAQKKGNTTLVTQRSNGVSTGTNIPQSTQNVNSSTSTRYSIQENQNNTQNTNNLNLLKNKRI